MDNTNRMYAQPCPSNVACTLITGDDLADYGKYLTDESRKKGQASAVAFPTSTAEVAAAVREAASNDWAVTVSGARNGVTARAVPQGGLVLSMERMNRVLGLRQTADDECTARCQPGVLLSALQKAVRDAAFDDSADWDEASRGCLQTLRENAYFFPPDPTETGASLGGLVACNASGAHTFRYGPTRPYIVGLTVVLADGSRLALERGQCRADASGCFILVRQDGQEVTVKVPTYRQPATKNVAGYYSGEGMDAVDLFIGSEGTLGVITEVNARLVRAPEGRSATMVFFRDELNALEFTEELRGQSDGCGVEAIEYFDPRSLRFLRESRREKGAASGVPACLPDDAACAVYLDIGTSADGIIHTLDSVARLAKKAGADAARCWSAESYAERERLRVFRHALPEVVNDTISRIQKTYPGVTKLGTDMAVPDSALRTILRVYRSELENAGLDYVIFGHIGDNHLHVNILPKTPEQYGTGKKLYLKFAEEVVRLGGSPAAEHGIGKLKTEFLKLMIGDRGIREMQAVKHTLDPRNRMGRGTLFGRVKGEG
ncbi:MAG: FAD-binding oxidoreductase [Candidatus Pacebacteria bacterium]|nr:FAD-binding oxidoreductase [Candidatus Paceibacterota bacterium]